jgi:hypothetical protein
LGKGIEIVRVYTETLPQAAAQWRALLDTSLAVPQQIPAYPDPASSAVAAAMADWPAIQEARTAQRNAAADKLVAWVDKTSVAFAAADHGGADAISGSVGPTLV